MEFWQLKCFSAVARSLNFSRAAETLYISQSALSQQIQSLEQELGTPLFNRSKRSVSLTPAGTALQRHIPGIDSALLQAESAVRAACAQSGQAVQLTLGIDEGFSDCRVIQGRLSDILIDLQMANARLQVKIRDIPYAHLERLLITGDIDMGFALMPEKDSSHIKFHSKKLVSTAVYRDDLQLIVADRLLGPDRPADIRALLDLYPLLVPKSDERILTHILRIMSSLDITPRLEYVETQLESRLVAEAGMGLILGPLNTALASVNNMTCIPFNVPEANMEYCALYSTENEKEIIRAICAALVH